MSGVIVRVADVMRRELHAIDGLASVAEAVERMEEMGVSSLVIHRRTPDDAFGIITVRDIAVRVMSLDKPLARTAVYEVMTKPALTVNAGMNIKYAVRLLARLGLGRALVLEGEELAGLVTLRDLVIGLARLERGAAHSATKAGADGA